MGSPAPRGPLPSPAAAAAPRRSDRRDAAVHRGSFHESMLVGHRKFILARGGGSSMKRSTDRILTTHAGSLPRPGDLLDMIDAKAVGHAVDEAAYAARLRSAVADIVRRQADLGVDVIDDGELSKPGFIH